MSSVLPPAPADDLSCTIDKSTFSNPAAVRVGHIHWDVSVDFEGKRVVGRADLSCTVLEAGSPALVLDSRALDITSVALNGTPAAYTVGPVHAAFGSAISVECVAARSTARAGVVWLDSRGCGNIVAWV
jgi:aminopeptidase N